MNPSLATAPQVVWFRGPDAVKFLNDLISQEIGTLEPGSVVQSLLLEPQGKLDFLLWVLRGEGFVGLVTEDGRGEELVARLTRYRIRVDVDIELEAGPVFLVVGRESGAGGRFETENGVLKADISWPSLVRQLQVGGGRPDLPPADMDELTRIRIGDGIPIFGVDVDAKTIPQEAGVVGDAVSFNKGCFLGQELVARLDSRGGRVNHRLGILEFESPVPVDTTLHAGDKEVGTVTSTSGSAGLDMLWREVEAGDAISAGGVATTVRALA
jgi:folate-binding protein YgfZ